MAKIIQSMPLARGITSSTAMNGTCLSFTGEVSGKSCSEWWPQSILKFAVIDSTLREGEQFATAWFATETKVEIARGLDSFGVDYIEVSNPAASEQTYRDCQAICSLNLKAKVLAHIRCHMGDIRKAVDAGVDGVNIAIGTSMQLRKHSHRKSLGEVEVAALEVIGYARRHGLETRFSCEDSFRSDLKDILPLYAAVAKAGVDRIGIADTVGGASPLQVYDVVRMVRDAVKCDIETHFHNDTGCAIANALCALEAGATHIDTCVLGIGERNGITPLGGLMARMMTAQPKDVMSRYNLSCLQDLENLVATAVEVEIPFNNYVPTSYTNTEKSNCSES